MNENLQPEKHKRSPRVLFKLSHTKAPGARPPQPWPVRLHPAALQLQLQEDPKIAGLKDSVAVALALTRREIEVLHHLCNGDSAKDTARALGIGDRTVECHLRAIRRKSGARNAVTVALWAVKNGIVRLENYSGMGGSGLMNQPSKKKVKL